MERGKKWNGVPNFFLENRARSCQKLLRPHVILAECYLASVIGGEKTLVDAVYTYLDIKMDV